jgi:hypothetical protein
MDQQGVLHYNVPYPDRLSRLLIFVKWLLVIPQAFVLYFVFLALMVTTFIAWWAILITGRYPRSLWDFAMSTLRWGANVGAYYGLLCCATSTRRSAAATATTRSAFKWNTRSASAAC